MTIKMTGSGNIGVTPQENVEVKPGIYKHWKSETDEYAVYGVATHRDTKEKIVVYRGLNNDGMFEWRSLREFTMKVKPGDIDRFTFIREFEEKKEL